jgi:hypothetical protein
MNNASLAAATSVSFTLNNSAISTFDVLALGISDGTDGAYAVTHRSSSGSAVITVRNLTAGPLSEAIIIRFAVIKGVAA